MTIPNDKLALKKIFSLRGDPVLWTVYFLLIAVSLIEVYSATSTLTFKNGSIMRPIIGHGTNLLIGFFCAWIMHNIPCRVFKIGSLVWVFSLALLALMPFIGTKINDGARWIEILGIRFQPSEFAKGSLVIVVAIILAGFQTSKGADRHAFRYILICTILTCLLIFTENFSTAGILFFVVFLMMYIGRVPLKQLGKLLAVLILLGAGLIATIELVPIHQIEKSVPALHRLDNFQQRINRFSSKSDTVEFDIDKEPQVGHAHIAIAKSHIFGCGPGNSRERDFLPQAYSDFIFAIIIEELGLAGGAAVVFLYMIILFRASRIANRCERSFPAFLVLGLALLIVVQAAVNMMVAVGLIPVTGQPLPLISRGGSSIMVTSMYIGMMISVSRSAKKRELQPINAETPDDTDESAGIADDKSGNRESNAGNLEEKSKNETYIAGNIEDKSANTKDKSAWTGNESASTEEVSAKTSTNTHTATSEADTIVNEAEFRRTDGI